MTTTDPSSINPDPKRPLPPQLEQIAQLVKLMDSQFRIPGTTFTFGIDPLLNFIPGVGWAIDFGISSYLFYGMVRNGASGKVVSKMALNIAADSLIGAIPVAGNIFDFAFKANRRNLKLAVEHFEEGKHEGSGWEIWLPALIIFILILILLGIGAYYVVYFLVKGLMAFFSVTL